MSVLLADSELNVDSLRCGGKGIEGVEYVLNESSASSMMMTSSMMTDLIVSQADRLSKIALTSYSSAHSSIARRTRATTFVSSS